MFSRVGAYRRVWRLRARIRKEKSPIPSAQTRDKRKEGRGEAITSRNEPRVPREKEEKEKARERERERERENVPRRDRALGRPIKRTYRESTGLRSRSACFAGKPASWQLEFDPTRMPSLVFAERFRQRATKVNLDAMPSVEMLLKSTDLKSSESRLIVSNPIKIEKDRTSHRVEQIVYDKERCIP